MVQDLVTTCSLWCVLSTSMTFHSAKQTVARPSLPRAGDAIHPVLGKGAVWFTRLALSYLSACNIERSGEGLGTRLGTSHKNCDHNNMYVPVNPLSLDKSIASDLLYRPSPCFHTAPQESLPQRPVQDHDATREHYCTSPWLLCQT